MRSWWETAGWVMPTAPVSPLTVLGPWRSRTRIRTRLAVESPAIVWAIRSAFMDTS